MTRRVLEAWEREHARALARFFSEDEQVEVVRLMRAWADRNAAHAHRRITAPALNAEDFVRCSMLVESRHAGSEVALLERARIDFVKAMRRVE